MKPRSGIMAVILLIVGLLLMHSPSAQGATLSLSVPNGKAGSTVTATLGFADATGVASFTATLYYPSEYTFFTPGSFVQNAIFLPSAPVGSQEANFIVGPSTGVFCVAGLKPNATTGAVTIGTLPFTVSAAAATEDERVVTLTGEIYTEDGTVEQLPPVSVLFEVGDPQDPELPTVTTTAVSGITQTTATSGGNATADGGATVTAKGVCWSTSANPTVALPTKTNNGSGIGSFVSAITGLTPGTPYHVRAYATNSVGTAYGNDVQFTTQSEPTTTTTTTLATTTTTTSTTSTTTTTLPVLTPCPECSGSPDNLSGIAFGSDRACTCSDDTSITLGNGLTVESGATVVFEAPTVTVGPGSNFKPGAKVVIKQK